MPERLAPVSGPHSGPADRAGQQGDRRHGTAAARRPQGSRASPRASTGNKARQIARRATGRTRTDPQGKAAGSRGGRDRRQARSAAHATGVTAPGRRRERGSAQGRSRRARARGSRIRAAGPCKHRRSAKPSRGGDRMGGRARGAAHAPGEQRTREKPRQDRRPRRSEPADRRPGGRADQPGAGPIWTDRPTRTATGRSDPQQPEAAQIAEARQPSAEPPAVRPGPRRQPIQDQPTARERPAAPGQSQGRRIAERPASRRSSRPASQIASPKGPPSEQKRAVRRALAAKGHGHGPFMRKPARRLPAGFWFSLTAYYNKGSTDQPCARYCRARWTLWQISFRKGWFKPEGLLFCSVIIGF
ncbi:hypothetical protein PARHAE_00010 [Paracoccus haematequi]|uniref:Uncharacterized protein n=1 Tax=Paracoccus haematequi TaxID=2491866 RepID=A0A447IH65_9RHOB|nr:hypothetical protein PARHAE_00010 [Paracoccus haematequi]